MGMATIIHPSIYLTHTRKLVLTCPGQILLPFYNFSLLFSAPLDKKNAWANCWNTTLTSTSATMRDWPQWVEFMNLCVKDPPIASTVMWWLKENKNNDKEIGENNQGLRVNVSKICCRSTGWLSMVEQSSYMTSSSMCLTWMWKMPWGRPLFMLPVRMAIKLWVYWKPIFFFQDHMVNMNLNNNRTSK